MTWLETVALPFVGGFFILIGLIIWLVPDHDHGIMTDTFSSYVEAINDGRYEEAIGLVDGDCLDNLEDIAPPEGAIEWDLLMAAEGKEAGMIAFEDNLNTGTSWQLMTKVDGDWKVACEVPW